MTAENETREPFDLERALAGEAVETKSGTKVKKLTLFDGVNLDHELIGVLDKKTPHIKAWKKSGHFLDKDDECDSDLVMSPKPKVIRYLWVNPSNGITAQQMLTEEEASERIGTHGFIKIPGSATEFPA